MENDGKREVGFAEPHKMGPGEEAMNVWCCIWYGVMFGRLEFEGGKGREIGRSWRKSGGLGVGLSPAY